MKIWSVSECAYNVGFGEFSNIETTKYARYEDAMKHFHVVKYRAQNTGNFTIQHEDNCSILYSDTSVWEYECFVESEEVLDQIPDFINDEYMKNSKTA